MIDRVQGPERVVSPHALVTGHLWLPPTRCRALGLRRSHSVWDDAVQEGNIGLMKAAQRFDADRGVRFEHYARSWVDSAIKTHLCTLGPVREPTRRVRDRAARGERAHARTTEAVEELAPDGFDESALLDAIDQRAHDTWMREQLAALPRRELAAVWATARGIGPAEFISRVGVRSRETYRIWKNAGLAKLVAAAAECPPPR